MVEETPQAGVLSEPEMNLDHTIDTLEQCYPDLPEKPQESRAMKSFLWTTTVVLWFGMIVLGLVAAFFVGVVGIAIYRAM